MRRETKLADHRDKESNSGSRMDSCSQEKWTQSKGSKSSTRSWGREHSSKRRRGRGKGKDEAEEFNAWSRVGEEASANQGWQRTTTTQAYGHFYCSTTTTTTTTNAITTTTTDRHSQYRHFRYRINHFSLASFSDRHTMAGSVKRRRLNASSEDADSPPSDGSIPEVQIDQWNGFCEVESEPVN